MCIINIIWESMTSNASMAVCRILFSNMNLIGSLHPGCINERHRRTTLYGTLLMPQAILL